MSDTIVDHDAFTDFCIHLSTGISVIDVLYKLRELTPGFDPRKDDPIVLGVDDPELLSRLKAIHYGDFIQACIRSLRIDPVCDSVFLSELDQEAFELFVWGFAEYAPIAKVDVDERGFILHIPALISDLVLHVLGRLHLQVLHALNHFLGILRAVDGDANSLFLNSKTPTLETQFIDLWVAKSLGIPIGIPGSGFTAVP